MRRTSGKRVVAGWRVATLESGIWAGGVPPPLAGNVIVCNELLFRSPELLNIDPCNDGWIAQIHA